MTIPRLPRGRRVAATAASAVLIGTILLPAAAASATTAVDDATPDRLILTPPQDPSTSQSFTWRTGADIVDGSVSIRLAGSDDEWRVVPAYVNDALPNDGIATRSHSATVDGLEPATEYEYFVGDGTVTSDTFTFTTAGSPGDPFSFIYFGDAQNDLAETWRPVVEQAYARYPDAVGTVNAGDLINNSNNTEWTQWFDGMAGYSETTNVIAAPGNHEYSGDSFLLNWKSNFEYDANGPKWDGATGDTAAARQEAAYREHMAEVITETAYFTDYQGVRFISLNASRSQARELFTPDELPACLIGCPDPIALWLDMQAQWLDEILTNNPNKWSVATFHQPVFSTAVGRDEADVRAAWLPVFQRNDIDLVLMGHDHTYARGYVNEDATSTPGMTTGPVYAVAVAGPKYYEQQPEDDNVWTRNGATQVVRAGSTSTFQGITVDGDTLRYESVVAAKWDGEEASTTDVPVGGVLDSFTITKYDDGSKYVTEDGVPIPDAGQGPGPDPEEPPAEEEPAGEPADVPLGHEVVGSLDASTAAEPGASAFDSVNGLLYVADQAPGSVGRIEEIDVATGAVLRSFDVGAPVIDMAYSPAEGRMLVVGFGDAEHGYAANGYSLTAEAFSQPLLEGDIPLPLPLRGVGLDVASGVVYFALEAGVILGINVDTGEQVGPFPVGADVQRLKVDQATGNLYVTFDSGDAGELRIYSGRNDMELLEQFDLDAGASSVDIDAAAGLVYVGHDAAAGEGGFSVVDVLGGTVTRASEARFGVDVESVSIDTERGLVFVTSATGDPAEVVVVGRHQAPRILTSPTATTVDEGEPATFTASAWGVPSPTVAWESRAPGSDEWSSVSGGDTAALAVPSEQSGTLTVTDGVTGTQYRAVFSNVIGGEEYSTVSATATLTVLAGPPVEEPGTDPGVEAPGDGATPAGQGPDELQRTGFDGSPLPLVIALGVAALGLALLTAARIRARSAR